MRGFGRGAIVVAVVVGMGVVGCGSESDCTLTPPLRDAPDSCAAQPGTTLPVTVNWCTCGDTAIRCDVRNEGGGVIQLEPVVTSCDASCPSVGTDCPALGVTCQVQIPAADVPNHLYIFGADNAAGFKDVPLSIGSNGCSG